MTSIYFDKDEYRAGETATITYVDAPANSLAAVRRGGLIIHRKVLISGGSGSFGYSIPTTLGTYKVELWSEERIIAHDTMYVVTGAAPPPSKGYLTVNTSPTGAGVRVGAVSCGTTPVTACELSPGWKEIILTKTGYNERVLMEEIKAGQTINLGTITLTPTGVPPVDGETRELELGEYEVTWTLSGCDTLNAEIRVTATGVTCLSVTSGACNSATPPGVTISTFTVTGYLKSVALPPVEIGSWIDESGVTNLTPSHAMYVYYLSQGATGAADTKYAGLSPKPSRMDPSIATVDNAMGIFYYSQGAMGAGNAKTGCNY